MLRTRFKPESQILGWNLNTDIDIWSNNQMNTVIEYGRRIKCMVCDLWQSPSVLLNKSAFKCQPFSTCRCMLLVELVSCNNILDMMRDIRRKHFLEQMVALDLSHLWLCIFWNHSKGCSLHFLVFVAPTDTNEHAVLILWKKRGFKGLPNHYIVIWIQLFWSWNWNLIWIKLIWLNPF